MTPAIRITPARQLINIFFYNKGNRCLDSILQVCQHEISTIGVPWVTKITRNRLQYLKSSYTVNLQRKWRFVIVTLQKLNNRQKKERTSISAAHSINLPGIRGPGRTEQRLQVLPIFNYLKILEYRQKNTYWKLKIDRCCHESDLEPRE